MKKKSWIALALAVSMTSLIACSNEGTSSAVSASDSASATEKDTASESLNAPQGGTVELGCTVHLTGPNQLAGSYYKNGVQMAVDEINAAGGILGKEVTMEYVDEGRDPQTAVNACEKVISMDVVGIMGSIVSTNCKAVLPLVKSAEVPYFAVGSNSTLAEEGAPWLWQVRVKDSLTTPIIVDVLSNELNVKNPAIIYNSAESTTLSMNIFVEKYKEAGIDIPKENIYACNEDETNFGNILSRIMADESIDGIWCAIVNSSQAMVVAQQIKSAGYDGVLMGNSVFSATEFRVADPAAAENWYCVVEWSSSLLSGDIPSEIPQESITFEEKYQALYGQASSPVSVQGYDSVYLFKAACEEAGTTDDKAAINEAMKKTDYQGAGNKYEYYGENVITTYIFLTQNKDGEAAPTKVVQIGE